MPLEVQPKPQLLPPTDGRMPPLISPGGERLSLMEVWRVLMKQRYVILAVTVLSFAGGLWYALRTPPVYESIARIEIRPQETPNIGIQQLISQNQPGASSQNDLQTEMQILQSDTVLYETAASLNLQERFSHNLAAAQVTNEQGQTRGADDMSSTLRRSMIQFIRRGLALRVVAGTDIVEIHYRSGDPKLGAAIANKLVETYADYDLHTKFDRTMHVSTWLQGQLDGLKREASDAQQQLADYQKAHNIVGTDENSNMTIQSLEDISSSLDNADADRIAKEARLRDFNALGPNMVALMGDNPNLPTLRSQLAQLQTQRAQMEAKYGPKYPKMVDLQTQIDRTQDQINAEVTLAKRQVEDEYQGAVGVENALRQRLGQQEDAAYKLNEGVAQYAILRNQAELTRDLYDTLQMRLKEATVTAGLSAANITVVDSAQVPYIPVAPRKRLAATMGLIGGLLGGCVLAFLIESIDDRLQTSDEVEAISMLPSLAAIPHFAGDAEKRRRRAPKELYGADLRAQLVTLNDSKSASAEAYRNLRSALLLSSIDHPPRIIVVTSAHPGEGKTTTAINCAIVLAQRGERVLLLDADLRRGRLDQVFGLSKPGVGLSTVLGARDAVIDIAAPLPELPLLQVLPTGPRPPNPAEMLSASRMHEQMRRWSAEYDRIVIDTAPLLAVSDTQALAVLADTTILVSRAGVTRRRAITRARDLLLRINAPIAGIVVNDVDVRLENFYTYRYGMYGYGYGYYGGRYGSAYSDRAYGYENENEETK